jgi:hypothetical protein
MTIRAVVAVLLAGLVTAVPANAQTMACSTSRLGYSVCFDRDGHRITGWTWDHMQLWDDDQTPVRPDNDLVARPNPDGEGK